MKASNAVSPSPCKYGIGKGKLIFLGNSDVYPECTIPPIRKLLGDLPREDVLLFTARLNNLVSTADAVDEYGSWALQDAAVSFVLAPSQRTRINQYGKRQKLDRRVDSVFVFSRPQLLEMYRQASYYCPIVANYGDTMRSGSARRLFSQTAFKLHDLYNTNMISSLSPHSNLYAERALGWDLNYGPVMVQTIARSEVLFLQCFLQSFPTWINYFEGHAGITANEFFYCAILLYSHTLAKISPTSALADNQSTGLFNPAALCGEDLRYFELTFNKFLTAMSHTADDIKLLTRTAGEFIDDVNTGSLPFQQFNFSALQRRPILQTSNGSAVIVDPRFYSDRICHGIVFECLRHMQAAKGKGDPFRDFGQAFQMYCSLVFKSYLKSTVLQPTRCFIEGASREIGPLEATQCDLYLQYEKTGIFFEIKTATIRDNTYRDVSSDEKLLTQLQQRYYKKDSGEDKGVAQLARYAREWASHIRAPSGCSPQSPPAEIIPVLVVYDELMILPGVSAWLADLFDKDLFGTASDLNVREYRGIGIHRLIIMTVSTVECLEEVFRRGTLASFLTTYSANYPDRRNPLSDTFTTTSFKEEFSSMLRIRAENLIDRSALHFFGKKALNRD